MQAVHERDSKRIIRGFTGLRGLAVLFVMFYHWFPHTVAGGYLGVVIFLSLSGYLVTDQFLRALKKEGDLDVLDFYKRRLKRLYPPLLFFMLLLTTWILLFQSDVLQNFRGGYISSVLGVNNWWQIFQKLSYFDQYTRTAVFTHLWTMALELQFYLLWPWIILALHRFDAKHLRRNTALVSLALAALSGLLMFFIYLIGNNVTRVYYGTDTRAFSFLFGAVLACVLSKNRLVNLYRMVPRMQWTLVSVVTVLLSLLLLFFLPGDRGITYYGGMFVANLVLLVLQAMSASPHGVLGRVMENPLFVYLGERSYSLYLWQFSIMALTEKAFRKSPIPMGASVIMQFFFVLLLAEITYQLTEKRAGRLVQLMNPRHWWKGGKLVTQSVAATVVCALLLITNVTALVQAPSGATEDVLEMEQRLKENEKAMKGDKSKPVPAVSRPGKSVANPTSKVPGEPKPSAPDAKAPEAKGTPVQQFDDVLASYPELKLTQEEAIRAAKLPFFGVGDSVLAMCYEDMKKLLPLSTYDATKSRQFDGGMEVLAQQKKQGQLPKAFLYALGTNGVISAGMVDQLAEAYPDHTIFLMTIVTPQPWEKNVNDIIRAGVAKHKNMRLIDWYSFAKKKQGLFYPDGTHPNIAGTPVYVQFVTKSIMEALK